ncbi:DUF4238 domain-containing protein [Caulobacter sp. NIBR2454]|uniref:DUF4238 domain-containing protein n=1 Tax=Caulobacter sp. NIBR2454 TaxID=3015996 RepID=UPI0022B6E845|nr:DUF4238 domain-containing protein [Caulobacter sp. NIBR2454]
MAPGPSVIRTTFFSLSHDVVAGLEKQSVETNFFQLIDDEAAKVRRKLAAYGVASLTERERLEWSRFLVSLIARQPRMVAKVRQEAPAYLRESLMAHPEEYEEVRAEAGPADLVEWTEEQHPHLIDNFGVPLLAKLTDDLGMREQFSSLRWVLIDVSLGGRNLLLSDYPLLLEGRLDENGFYLSLPISPTQLFVGYRDEKFRLALSQTSARQLSLRSNTNAVRRATERVISVDGADMAFVVEQWAANPPIPKEAV